MIIKEVLPKQEASPISYEVYELVSAVGEDGKEIKIQKLIATLSLANCNEAIAETDVAIARLQAEKTKFQGYLTEIEKL